MQTMEILVIVPVAEGAFARIAAVDPRLFGAREKRQGSAHEK